MIIKSGELPTECARYSWRAYRQYLLAIAFESRYCGKPIAFQYY